MLCIPEFFFCLGASIQEGALSKDGAVRKNTARTIYNLRNLRTIAQNRAVIHKIGVTGGDVKSRLANARHDPTYLLADVEIVATFTLINLKPTHFEALLHQFFGNARLDLELHDRFGLPVKPREWFLVPLDIIEATLEKIKAGTIDQFRYDPTTASLTQIHPNS